MLRVMYGVRDGFWFGGRGVCVCVCVCVNVRWVVSGACDGGVCEDVVV